MSDKRLGQHDNNCKCMYCSPCAEASRQAVASLQLLFARIKKHEAKTKASKRKTKIKR